MSVGGGGNLAIHLLAGMSLLVRAPVKKTHGTGWFPKQDYDEDGELTGNTVSIKFNDEDRDLLNGFLVLDEDVGELVDPGTTPNEVEYKHHKAAENEIWFFADTNEIGVVSIVPTPIHDHSSVVQGGPAYGTYFSDDEEFSGDTS